MWQDEGGQREARKGEGKKGTGGRSFYTNQVGLGCVEGLGRAQGLGDWWVRFSGKMLWGHISLVDNQNGAHFASRRKVKQEASLGPKRDV